MGGIKKKKKGDGITEPQGRSGRMDLNLTLFGKEISFLMT